MIEISLNYICKYERCDQIKVFVDNKSYFADIILDKDQEPLNVDECSRRTYWPQWRTAIKAELESLAKREVCRLGLKA